MRESSVGLSSGEFNFSDGLADSRGPGSSSSLDPDSYRKSEHSKDEVFGRLDATASFGNFSSTVGAFNDFIEISRKLGFKFSKSFNFESDFGAAISLLEQYPLIIESLITDTNALPEPSSIREIEIGEAFLPLAMRQWKKQPPEGSAKYLYDVYAGYRVTGEGFDILTPEWLENVALYLRVKEMGGEFPGMGEYLGCSEVVGEQYRAVVGEIVDCESALADMEAMNEKQKRLPDQEDPYGAQIVALKAKLVKAQDKLPELFQRFNTEVHDVDPSEVPSALNALDVKLSTGTRVLNSLCLAARSIESILTLAAVSRSGKKVNPAKLKLPYFKKDRKLDVLDLTLSSKDIAAIGSSEKDLTKLLGLLVSYRDKLCRLSQSFQFIENKSEVAEEVVNNILVSPILNFGDVGKDAVLALLAVEDYELKVEVCNLMSPAVYDKERDTWSYILEDTDNYSILTWAINNFMDAKPGPETDTFEGLLCASLRVEKSIVGILKEAKEYIRKNDDEGLALFIEEQIGEQKDDPQLIRILGFISLCSYLSQHPKLSNLLKLKIPSIQELKALASTINRNQRELKSVFTRLAGDATRVLSNSLDDFYLGKDQVKLETCIRNFQMVNENPDILKGIRPTNIKQGLALLGEPGVGKTFFVECLLTDLGLKGFFVSPSKKKPNETMIDMLTRITNEAIEYSKTKGVCMLFFDEAEAIMPERDDPRSTSEQKDRTDHVLQLLDEIRSDYPSILPVVASNFEHKLDEAVLRPGRIDFHLRRKRPVPALRKHIITDTLKTEGIESISDSEIEKLVSLTDGFLILRIITPIYELSRIESLVNKGLGKSEAVTFSALEKAYELERRELEIENERRESKSTKYDVTESGV